MGKTRRVQRGQDPCLTLKPGETLRIAGEVGWQGRECDLATRLCVARTIGLAHTSGAERAKNRIRSEPTSGKGQEPAGAAAAPVGSKCVSGAVYIPSGL